MDGIEIPRRMDVIREYRARKGLIGAVFPIHYPRALLRAFDILPVEVWGPPRIKASHSSKHLQPYVCSIVHNALSFLQSGGLEVVDLLLVPHTCDSLQGLGSILLDFIKPKQPVLTLYIPRGQRTCDVDFLAEELRNISLRLGEITGRSPSHAELIECIQREETADGLLADLHRQHPHLPLSDEAFYRFVRGREYLPSENFIDIARKLLAQATETNPTGIPLLLSGIVPEPMSLFAALAEMGGRIAADDLACCRRRLYRPGRSKDPFQRMAESIIEAPPDPTRGSPIHERLEYLTGLAHAFGARGVIFYDVKFCEPELFDLPQLRQGLRQADLPSISIEVELNDELAQPVLDRLAAFLEMVT